MRFQQFMREYIDHNSFLVYVSIKILNMSIVAEDGETHRCCWVRAGFPWPPNA